MVSIKVNDIIDELFDENKRLLNELLFAKKCLNVLIKFKICFDLHFNHLTINLCSKELQMFKDLDNQYKDVLKQKPKSFNKNNKTNEENNDKQNDDSISKPFPSDVNRNAFKRVLPKTDLNLNQKQLPKDSIESYKQNQELNTNLPLIATNKPILMRKLLKCPEISCNKLFESEELLLNHMQSNHMNPQTTQTLRQRLSYKKSIKAIESNAVNTNVNINQINNNRNALNDSKQVNSNRNSINERNKPKLLTLRKPFKCEVIGCVQSFDDKESEISHRLSAHPIGTTFKCDFPDCRTLFLTEPHSKLHFKTHLIKNGKHFLFVCEAEDCDYRSEIIDRIKIIGHIYKHKGIKPFKCSYDSCDSAFVTKYRLNYHIRNIHKMENQAKCDFPNCNQIFKTQYQLNSHQLVHTDDKPLPCDHPDCVYRAKDSKRLKKHKRIHTIRPLLSCTVEGCLKTFKDRHSLKQHLERHRTEGRFKCLFVGCDKVFRDKAYLKSHQIYHTNQFYRCDWPGCDFKTKLQSSIRMHKLSVHSNNRPFGCYWPGCDKRFKTKKHLGIHLRIHNNDKRYACQWPGCEYRSTVSGNLKLHQKIHQK